MSKDYCGIFLEGMSRVFESSLINAPYDKTVVGIIVEDFQSASGKYIVSYQGTNYSASPRDSGAIYAKNDTVYLIKQANLDQYMILGKKITQADLAVQVVNPYTKYARLLDYKPDSETISAVDNKYTFPTWQINTNEEYDTITISGGFKTAGVTSYRFIFNFTTIENKKYEVTLSESEIFGATNSGGFINRKHLFDITGVGKIKAVDISLTWTGGGEEGFKLQNLVFELGINLDKLAVDGDRLEIYINDALTYLTSAEKRTINTKWIYTNEDEKSVVYTHLNTTVPVGYEVRWYRAQKDSTDMYAGDGWIQIATNQDYPFRCILENLSRTSNEQIKLIILKLDTTTSTIIPIESNVLEFINETISETEELYDLRFNYGAGNSNVYALWDLDGVLRDPTQENKKYKVDLKYKTAYSNEELNERLRQGVWRIPASCLRFVAGGPHSDEVAQETGYSILTRNYIKLDFSEATKDIVLIEKEKKDENGQEITDTEQLQILLQKKKEKEYLNLLKENIDAFFSIQYSPLMQYKQDSIEDLQVEIYTIDESKVYELSTQLVFTKESDDGTGYSMTVRFKDGVEVIATALQRGKTYNVEINVYDANSQPVSCNPTWEIKELDESGNRKTAPELFTKENAMIKVKSEGTTYYYASLIVTAKVTDAKLKKEVPIALTSSGELKYSGPIEIVYDAAGKVKNFNSSYLTILDSNFEELEGKWDYIANWQNPSTKVEQIQEDNTTLTTYPYYYYPKVNSFSQTAGETEKTLYRISPYEIFESSKRDNYGYALKWTNGQKTFYQPIIIRQATSFSPLIDDWDGKFKIDENTGTVMSSVMVAGNKNSGSFSGVILGEISKTGGQSETGILGYHEGSQSYGFLDDGTAFIGKSGAGQINFNGTSSKISGGGFDGTFNKNDTKYTTKGTLIDLQAGKYHTPNFHIDEYGNIYMKGGINLLGNITWSESNNPNRGSFKKIDTYLREYKKANWKKFGQKDYEAQWSVKSPGDYDNSYINIGDTAYIEGIVSDVNNAPIKLYCKVTNLDYVNKVDPNVGYAYIQAKTIGIESEAFTYETLLTQLNKDGDGIYSVDGKIGINASMIQTGLLKVLDPTKNVIFQAGWDKNNNPLVQLAGWTATSSSLTSKDFTPGTSTEGIGLYTGFPNSAISINGISRSNWRIIAGQAFGVTKTGELIASNAIVNGTITAKSGAISDFTISKNGITWTALDKWNGLTSLDTLQLPVFFVGATSKKASIDAPLRIWQDGRLETKELYISGGTIGRNSTSVYGFEAGLYLSDAMQDNSGSSTSSRRKLTASITTTSYSSAKQAYGVTIKFSKQTYDKTQDEKILNINCICPLSNGTNVTVTLKVNRENYPSRFSTWINLEEQTGKDNGVVCFEDGSTTNYTVQKEETTTTVKYVSVFRPTINSGIKLGNWSFRFADLALTNHISVDQALTKLNWCSDKILRSQWKWYWDTSWDNRINTGYIQGGTYFIRREHYTNDKGWTASGQALYFNEDGTITIK